jgi:hypothetical protein
MYSDPTGHREEKDAFIFDKKTQDTITKASNDWDKAAQDYKNGKITKTERDKRQDKAHQKAEDARENYAKKDEDYANITTKVENKKTVYEYAGNELVVVNNQVKFKDTNDISPKSSITTSKPDAITQNAINNITGVIDEVLKDTRTIFSVSYSIYDYSYGKVYNDKYENEKAKAAQNKAAQITADLAYNIIAAGGSTGTSKGDAGIGILNHLFDPTPGIKDIELPQKNLDKAKEKSDYINDSMFKYLIYSSFLPDARGEFIGELMKIEKRILIQDVPIYDNESDNIRYKQAMLSHVQGIIDMNTNYSINKGFMDYCLNDIDKKYK